MSDETNTTEAPAYQAAVLLKYGEGKRVEPGQPLPPDFPGSSTGWLLDRGLIEEVGTDGSQ
jgi:hypothetical protein